MPRRSRIRTRPPGRIVDDSLPSLNNEQITYFPAYPGDRDAPVDRALVLPIDIYDRLIDFQERLEADHGYPLTPQARALWEEMKSWVNQADQMNIQRKELKKAFIVLLRVIRQEGEGK